MDRKKEREWKERMRENRQKEWERIDRKRDRQHRDNKHVLVGVNFYITKIHEAVGKDEKLLFLALWLKVSWQKLDGGHKKMWIRDKK